MRFSLLKTALALTLIPSAVCAEEYKLGPDSNRKPGVPRGAVSHHTWKSTIFPGTVRDYWVYVPAQYNAAKKACLMVFQDGGGYIKDDGSWRVPIVFDNLIASGEMPVTIGVFVNPGIVPALSEEHQPRFNRGFEYDSMGPRYARFLIEELLPDAVGTYNISPDPNDRAIAGSSSGGIAAFTAAFNRPDAFRRVMSFIGSFANLRGGDVYAALIRKMEPLPLRVFLQDGSNDLNLYAGNWYLANQEIASSLDLSGYEYKFVEGTEGHNGKHGSAILPDALRWLWKDYPKPVSRSKEAHGGTMTVERHFITQILDPDSDWELASQKHAGSGALAVNADGEVVFADSGSSRILRIPASGEAQPFIAVKEKTGAMMFASDGRLYAAEPDQHRVVAYKSDGASTKWVDGVSATDLAVTSRGGIYFDDAVGQKIYFVDPQGKQREVYSGPEIRSPAGIHLSADEAFLFVADNQQRSVWSFEIGPDGSLAAGEPFYHLELPDNVDSGAMRTAAQGVTSDTEGFVYTATNLGIQISDPGSKTVGIIRNPSGGELKGLVFGGPDLQTLYAVSGDRVFRRHLRRKGSLPGKLVKLPVPEL